DNLGVKALLAQVDLPVVKGLLGPEGTLGNMSHKKIVGPLVPRSTVLKVLKWILDFLGYLGLREIQIHL
ncbi:hypothetical protein L0F63_007114, partial [Massospora cicadina]